ncbi:hypothetical protein [Pseudomonas brassicacearum]|uniref:Uncharacterized protein n=1 Tax=Pseudomonas brassicacearum TaxID=930166 RepID=A0A423GRI6_9PSED|nr:hypothetical protein [Pseudomonas brassicacearum]ROM96922.1 hypothetical protein BK658_14990 [Pseudomonas brassicacearum]
MNSDNTQQRLTSGLAVLVFGYQKIKGSQLHTGREINSGYARMTMSIASQRSGDDQVGAFAAQDWCGASSVIIQPIDSKAFMPLARALRSPGVRVTRSTA